MKYEYGFLRGVTVEQWFDARSTTLLGAKREAWGELGDSYLDGVIKLREVYDNGDIRVVATRKVIASTWEDTV